MFKLLIYIFLFKNSIKIVVSKFKKYGYSCKFYIIY